MKKTLYLLLIVSTTTLAQTKEYKEGIFKTYQDYLSNNIIELKLKSFGLQEMVLEKYEDKANWDFKNKDGEKIEYGCFDFWAYQDVKGSLYTTRKLVWGKKNKTYLMQLIFWVVGDKHSLASYYYGTKPSSISVSAKFHYYLSNPSDNFVQPFTHKDFNYFGNKTPASMFKLSGYNYDVEEKKVISNKGIMDPEIQIIYRWKGIVDPLHALTPLQTYIHQY